jgi:hypothetical protein
MPKAAVEAGIKAVKTKLSAAAAGKGADQAECIRQKSYEHWEKKGRVQGKDLEIWLEAERAVRGRVQ